MNLAITLLVAVAIASVIGTVLQQNQPYTDYIIKFGPFWFEVFRVLGLYDVYSATWFLAILGFLVVSTSVCIYRNTPAMVRDMRRFGENVRVRALRAFTHRAEWTLGAGAATTTERVERYLRGQGYRVRRKTGEDHMVVAGRRGAANRLGYILTHAAIVVICLGGLIDGSAGLKLATLTGQLEIETRDIPASQVPEASRLEPGNPSFRGSVTVPEGSRANIAFINMRDGYVVQELPFAVEVREFRVEHYSTGQPKSFESDLVIHDDRLEAPLERTIAVNHPLTYRGYSIYQASFGDGGSKLDIKLWPLAEPGGEPRRLSGEVFGEGRVPGPEGPLTLEFTDFTLFNVQPVRGEDGETEQRNFGPSFTFKVRDETGQAREYINYMSPVDIEGGTYYLSGVRSSPADPFQYLHIPAGPQGGIERFMRFYALLHDEATVARVAAAAARRSVQATEVAGGALETDIADGLHRLVRIFRSGGFDAVVRHVERVVPDDQQRQVMQAYLRVLQQILWELYAGEILGVEPQASAGTAEARFFDDAVSAIGVLSNYDSPFYLQLAGFDHVEASGLQITRAPGKNIVYLGCGLLIAGVFVMFYVRLRRIWAWIEEREGGTRVLLAGSENRNSLDFSREFQRLRQGLDRALGAESSKG
ncbi:MAG: cytochrome c biogenesis protein ResB [Gammaproteobacteria bacterium]|nr:cytochrome c biogenesis protein ResB [Gammaproteobacteria bacterium]